MRQVLARLCCTWGVAIRINVDLVSGLTLPIPRMIPLLSRQFEDCTTLDNTIHCLKESGKHKSFDAQSRFSSQ